MKKLSFLSMLLLVAGLFLAGGVLTSCGDDDNKTDPQGGGGSGSSVNIVGTWRTYYQSHDSSRGRVYDDITYNSNHTGFLIEEVGYGSDEPESFKWQMSGNDISITWDEEPDKAQVFTIVEVIDSNTVMIKTGDKTVKMERVK